MSDDITRFNIELPSFGCRKATKDEIDRHNAMCDEIIKARAVLMAINALISESGLVLHQSEIDCGDWSGKPDILLGDSTTFIDNENGLFYLPDAPEKWDENTLLEPNFPIHNDAVIMYTMSNSEQTKND